MNKYFSHYCALISSRAQLDECRHAQSLGDLLACIKKLWLCEQISDDELLGEITQLNQTPISIASVILAGNWLPYRYQTKRGLVSWLIPIGHATEPFQDEYISRCRQHLFNQIIQPSTSLAFARQQAENVPDIQPAGFIFHLSRCGSTLISGCLSELDSTCVFSESPLLTELLLDSSLPLVEQKSLLMLFIHLQAAAFPARPHVIIKWNAWDIFRWSLIRDIYPQVPVLFLVRNPVEILASHWRSAGRHMSGDSALSYFHPVFDFANAAVSLQEKCIHVLQELLMEMREKISGTGVRVLDYQQLNLTAIATVLRYFNVPANGVVFLKIQARMQFHSKYPGQVFAADSTAKKQLLAQHEQEKINSQLAPHYNQLLTFALALDKETLCL